MKLKKTKTGWEASHGPFMRFEAVRSLSGIEIKATHRGMEFRLEAKSIADAERKIAAFVSASIAEINADREIRQAEFADFHAAQAQAKCVHVWVDQPITDRLNIVSHSNCSKCGESKIVPRSN